jgi:hypothetical protein
VHRKLASAIRSARATDAACDPMDAHAASLFDDASRRHARSRYFAAAGSSTFTL